MADDWLDDAARRAKAAALVDPTMPNPGRVGDHLTGGRDNFEADRRASRSMIAASPVMAAIVPAGRAFQRRVVRYLAAEAGIRQFLDISARLTMSGNTHEIAQSLAPDCRIVYASSDPVVLSHARALAMSTNAGAVAALDADVHYPRTILAGAAETLDFGRPVAVLLMATLMFVLDDALAAEIMRSLTGAVPAGSHVALYHQASDLDPEVIMGAQRWNAMSDRPITLRSRAGLAGLLPDVDLVPPGLVPVTEWRPEPADPRFGHVVPVYGAVARKP
jgi:S-adenosyl methyltransferase